MDCARLHIEKFSTLSPILHFASSLPLYKNLYLHWDVNMAFETIVPHLLRLLTPDNRTFLYTSTRLSSTGLQSGRQRDLHSGTTRELMERQGRLGGKKTSLRCTYREQLAWAQVRLQHVSEDQGKQWCQHHPESYNWPSRRVGSTKDIVVPPVKVLEGAGRPILEEAERRGKKLICGVSTMLYELCQPMYTLEKFVAEPSWPFCWSSFQYLPKPLVPQQSEPSVICWWVPPTLPSKVIHGALLISFFLFSSSDALAPRSC